jgi:hypothetical protein
MMIERDMHKWRRRKGGNRELESKEYDSGKENITVMGKKL